MSAPPHPGTPLPFAAERARVALACRILAMEGLVETTLGHVSLRVAPDRLLVRARGDDERGLWFTGPGDIALVDLEGHLADGEPPLVLPAELPIHTALLAADPSVGSVVHAHPPEVVACTVAGVTLRPVVGAYNIPAMLLAAGGIPTFAYSGLVDEERHATGLRSAMGSRPACLLQGHGLVTVGESVEEAVLRAIDVQALARITLTAGNLARALVEVDLADHDSAPPFGRRYVEQLWRFYVVKAARLGLEGSDRRP